MSVVHIYIYEIFESYSFVAGEIEQQNVIVQELLILTDVEFVVIITQLHNVQLCSGATLYVYITEPNYLNVIINGSENAVRSAKERIILCLSGDAV